MKFAPQRLNTWVAEVDAEPAPRWLIKDFLGDDSLTMLSGHPKSLGRKSLLAMLQALALATGKPIEHFNPARQLPVLYCYHEGARKATSIRLQMLCNGAGIQAADVRDFFMLHRSLMDLRAKSDVKIIGDWCKDNRAGLVVFDTLAKSMLGDEDSAENMGRVVRGIEEARGYGLSVLLLHHLNKQSASMVGGNFDPDRDMRGSGALAGAYETHQAVRHYSYNHTRADLLVSNKDGQEFAHKHHWEFVNTEVPGSTCGEIDLNAAYTKLHMGPRIAWSEVGVLDDQEVGDLMRGLQVGSCYTPDMLAAAWHVSKTVAQDLVTKLIGIGELESAKYGFRVAGGDL